MAAQKEHENIVQSGVPRAGEFHENAQIFNLLIPIFSHEYQERSQAELIYLIVRLFEITFAFKDQQLF